MSLFTRIPGRSKHTWTRLGEESHARENRFSTKSCSVQQTTARVFWTQPTTASQRRVLIVFLFDFQIPTHIAVATDTEAGGQIRSFSRFLWVKSLAVGYAKMPTYDNRSSLLAFAILDHGPWTGIQGSRVSLSLSNSPCRWSLRGFVYTVNKTRKGKPNGENMNACTREFHGYKYKGLPIQCISWVKMESRERKKDKRHTWSRGSRA